MSTNDISAKSTHTLWVESRLFQLDISRPTPTTIALTVTRPTSTTIVDGAIILLNDRPITGNNFPVDGTQHVASSNLSAPADILYGPQGAHVVAFYSEILGIPWPVGVDDLSTGLTSFTITITNTLPNVLYYASVHPSTNILQYYPIGVQSYPLEASRIEKDSSTFTGNIPSLAEAPIAPTVGLVYHDQQLNLVQYWTGTQWIPTRSDAILTGPVNPGIPGQTYILSGSIFKVFSGTQWIEASPTNFQFRVGAGWVPFVKVTSVTKLPIAPVIGEMVWDYTTLRAQYWDGIAWIYPNSTNCLFDTGTGIIPAVVLPITIETSDLPTPSIGQLFYNTTSQVLNVWTGTVWKQANTDQQGTVSTDKISIGTDGSYDERVRLINVLKGQLGWPQTCVELKEEQFNIAIDNALDNYRMWCAGAYTTNYVMFSLAANQQTYYLNSAIDKTDRIVDVTKIHRLNVLGIQAVSGNDAIWSSGILTSYYSAVTVDILSMHMISALSEDFQRLFAGDLTFNWNEARRELFITRKISRPEKVIIECSMEKTEQEILLDRWSKQFIQNWALSENKYQLGMIRSKYSSGTPGAAGSITLNGEMLIAEARQDQTELKQSCLDYEFGGLVNGGNCSFLFA